MSVNQYRRVGLCLLLFQYSVYRVLKYSTDTGSINYMSKTNGHLVYQSSLRLEISQINARNA